MKKINSKWYSIEKIKYEKHQYHYIKDPNGYLYVNPRYNTKIKAEDFQSVLFMEGSIKGLVTYLQKSIN